jgi:hypothetical protein
MPENIDISKARVLLGLNRPASAIRMSIFQA